MRRQRPMALLLAAIVFAVGLIHLGRPSLWFDEAFSLDLARMPWSSFAHTVRVKEGNQALYFLLLKLWQPIDGSDFATRLLSVLFTSLAAPFVFGIGRRLYDDGVGVLAALLLAVLPFSLQATQEARGYSLLMLASSVSMWFLIRADADGKRWWIGYSLSAALLTYVHLYGIFVLLAQIIWAFSYSNRRRFLGALILAVILDIPIFTFFIIHRGSTQLTFLGRPAIGAVPAGVAKLGGNEALGIAILALAAVGVARGLRSQRRATSLVALWLLLAPVLAITASVVGKPAYQLRYLAGETPALVLLVVVGLHSTVSRGRSLAAGAALVAGCAVSLPGHFGPLVHQDWRDADALVSRQLLPRDQVLTYPWYLGPAVSVYLHGEYGEVQATAGERATGPRVWILSFTPTVATPPGYRRERSWTVEQIQVSLYARKP